MKKITVLLLALAAAFLLVGCTKNGEENIGTKTQAETAEGLTAEDIDIDFDVQYIRTNGYHEDAVYPAHRIITSSDDLTDYYNEFKDMYDLERKETVYSDTTIGFLDACDKYDLSFFGEKAILFVILEEGSGSVRHRVDSIRCEDGRLTVSIEKTVPICCTDDMAEWHIFIELDKEYLLEHSDNVDIIYI